MTKKIEEVRHLGEKKRPIATGEIYDRDYSRYAFSYPTDTYKYVLKPGLSREVVEEISAIKNEPKWMREFRLHAYEVFLKKPMPTWGGDLSHINFDTITYYATPTDKGARRWEDVPEEVKKTFDRLGIPEAERKFLAGVGAQYDSEVVYHSIREDLAKKGVIFLSMDDGLREYPDLVREYIGTVIPPTDNKFAALNSAVWSGGCLTAEARLFTADGGIKSIAEIQPGDTVAALSAKGELVPAKVLAHIYNGRKPVYRFRVAGRTLEATGNHMFLTLEKSPTPVNRFGRKWVPVWKPLADLKVGDVVAIAKRVPWAGKSKPLPPLPLYRKNHHLQRSLRAPARTNPDLMWLLGVWMGDGNTYAPHPHMRCINFALPESDPARREAMRLVRKLFHYSVKTQTPVSFTVHSKALGEWLAELGFSGKAKTKRIPAWVFELPVEERLAFLGGLLDADGWVENTGKMVCFELANKQLIEEIKLLAISCGLFSDGKIRERARRATPLTHERRQIVSGTTYACRITGNVALIGSRNPRWRALLDQARKRTFDKYTTVTGENFSSLVTEDIGFAPIREKEYIGVRDVYDIQVEEHANFVANGIIAHNSFIYVPKGVHVEIPLQAYFRINAPQMGQFERTLIIADEDARVHYIEGCTAPIYSRESLHAAVVELIAKRGAHLRYTTLQNWSNDVYNLVTKRAVAYEDATVEWVDANIGCLTADTKVFLNPRGAVTIAEVKADDWVYALDLNTMAIVKRPVKGVVCTGVKPVFKLTTENFREIKATANHPFLVLQRAGKHWRLVWKPLEQLRVGDYIALSQGLPDEGKPYRIGYQPQLKRIKIKPRLPRETSEELMWLLGLYLGDGFIERGGRNVPRRVYFAVPEGDPARPKLIELLQQLFGVGWKPKGISVTVNSAILADFLLSLGFSGTAREKHLPSWVFGLPLRQKLAFIEGYLDADGHVRRHQGKDGKLYGQVTFASCNRELLEDLKLLMISCGLSPLKISSYSRERVLVGQYKGVYTTHYLNLPLGDLEMMRAKAAVRPSVEFVRVLAVEPWGEEPVYDIEVEGAHNFIANGLIVHNSRLTMKYPSVYMLGKGARADILSVAFAGKGQHQDTGGKAIHAAPYTTSTIVSKSVSKDGGRATYRGQLVVAKGAHHAKSNVRCDALILDERSRSDTYPYIEIDEDQVTIGHEATVGKVGDDQIFYLMSRGLSESEALSMIVLGFMEPFTKTLPMEYAIEFNRLIQLEMEGSVG